MSEPAEGPSEVEHADALYKHEYAHGTQYLGRMGQTAFAHFDQDDNGMLFPLAMNEADFDEDDWERVDADEIPENILKRIERQFEDRKSFTEVLGS